MYQITNETATAVGYNKSQALNNFKARYRVDKLLNKQMESMYSNFVPSKASNPKQRWCYVMKEADLKEIFVQRGKDWNEYRKHHKPLQLIADKMFFFHEESKKTFEVDEEYIVNFNGAYHQINIK